MFQGSIRCVPREFQGWYKKFSRVVQEWCVNVFQGSFKVVSSMYEEGFKQVCFKGVLKNLKGALRMFPGCFMGISKRFKEVSSSMALIAATRAEGGLVTLKLAELDHEI